MAAFKSTGLWRPEFPVDRVLNCDRLELRNTYSVQPLGLFTMLSFDKLADEQSPRDNTHDKAALGAGYQTSTAEAGL